MNSTAGASAGAAPEAHGLKGQAGQAQEPAGTARAPGCHQVSPSLQLFPIPSSNIKASDHGVHAPQLTLYKRNLGLVIGEDEVTKQAGARIFVAVSLNWCYAVTQQSASGGHGQEPIRQATRRRCPGVDRSQAGRRPGRAAGEVRHRAGVLDICGQPHTHCPAEVHASTQQQPMLVPWCLPCSSGSLVMGLSHCIIICSCSEKHADPALLQAWTPLPKITKTS